MRYIPVNTQDVRRKTQDMGRGNLQSIVYSLESFVVVISILLFVTFPAFADIGEEERDEVVGTFGALLVPSVFTTAGSERLGASLYGRTLTGEGEVPDFDGNVRDSIDQLQLFASGRMKGLGLTLGLSPGSTKLEFSQPFILSVDYKAGLLEETPIVDAAVDAQYSMIVLTDKKDIEVSALGFGVFSINGIVSANLLVLEPYAGLTLNYVYINAKDEDFIGVWKPIPKLGLQYTVLPLIKVGAEIAFIKNKHLNSSWMWNMGVSVKL